MKTLLFIFGTRPEAIKMAPVIKELQKHPKQYSVRVCVTAQHRQMLDKVLELFDIVPDYDLDIMKPGQSLTDITCNVLSGLASVYDKLSKKIDAVSADLKAHRADTEAHHGIYRVKECRKCTVKGA